MERVSSYVCTLPWFMSMCMLSYLMVSKIEDISYLSHECLKDQQTHVCQSAVRSPKEWTWRIYLLLSCWTCISSCLAGSWSGKAESGFSGAVNDHGMQRCCVAKWPQHSRRRAGHWGAFTLSGWGVRRLAQEIPLQVFQLSDVACPWPHLFLGTFPPFCRNLWSQTLCRWQK